MLSQPLGANQGPQHDWLGMHHATSIQGSFGIKGAKHRSRAVMVMAGEEACNVPEFQPAVP